VTARTCGKSTLEAKKIMGGEEGDVMGGGLFKDAV
jgi:hypothetical protein